MSAGDIAVQITLDGKNYSSAAGKVIAINRQMQKSIEDAGHSTVSQMQASSAAIRALENPLGNNLRAVERFLTTIPGVGAALKVAFPAVGAIAFAGVLSETIAKTNEFMKVQRQIPDAIKTSFAALNLETQSTNDALQLTNDRLANDIAKLQGKPQNNLAIAIDEARMKADDLAKSLEKDSEQLSKLLAKNRVNLLGGLMGAFGHGNAATGETENNINNFQAQIQGRGNDIADAMAIGDTQGATQARQELARLRTNYNAYLAGALKEWKSGAYSEAGDPSANINILQGAQKDEGRQERQDQIKEQNANLVAQKQQVEDAKNLQQKQLEAARKAAEEQMQRFQASFAQFKIDFAKKVGGDVPINEEISFWQKMQGATTAGSKNYIEIQKTIASEMGEAQKQMEEQRKKDHARYLDQQKEDAANAFDLPRAAEALSKAQAEIQNQTAEKARQQFDAQAKLTEMQNEIATATAAASARMLEQVGALSRHDAAMQIAGANAEAYKDKLKMLQGEAADMALHPLAGTPEDPDPQKRRMDLNQAQQDQLARQYGVQRIEDNAAVNSTTLSGSFHQTMQKFIQESQDTAGQISQIMTGALQGYNSTLSNVFTAHYRSSREFTRSLREGLSSTTRGIGSQVMNIGLQKAEGGLLSSLGLGTKPDGSQSKPFYVQMAGLKTLGSGLGSTGSSLMSGAASALKSGSSGIGGILGSVGSIFQGFFADGGDVVANRPSIVGERGAELFVPHTAGKIIPNSKMATGGTTNVHNWDLRYSNDSRQMKRDIERGLQTVHGSASQNGARIVREHMLRRPKTAGI